MPTITSITPAILRSIWEYRDIFLTCPENALDKYAAMSSGTENPREYAISNSPPYAVSPWRATTIRMDARMGPIQCIHTMPRLAPSNSPPNRPFSSVECAGDRYTGICRKILSKRFSRGSKSRMSPMNMISIPEKIFKYPI